MEIIKDFDFIKVENNVKNFWTENKIYNKIKARNIGKKKYYFLDGPPYTNGKVHLGTAWNKSLKDSLIRYKRMKGFDVWDRAGWDNHGLPTEWAVQKKFNLKDSVEVKEFGSEKFIKECEKFCHEMKDIMTTTFENMGIWMDFEKPYMTLSKEWTNSVWWFIKTAHEKQRLYQGLRTMTWDIPAATAVAKHELEYKEVEDTAIFVKFKLTSEQGTGNREQNQHADSERRTQNADNEFLVIWTTTPWTIPFNLAVMVNPELNYCKVEVDRNGKKEFWWICEDLVDNFLTKLKDVKYSIEETIKGEKLEGWEYEHPFAVDMNYPMMKEEYPKLHTVLLSKEYVDTSAGSGLVHCAPGCGPEDYEVGYRNGLPAFNTVNENGIFEHAGRFNGLVAKKDDFKFIEELEKHGHLIFTHLYVHDYPFDQRSKEPVIFRTTKQWFLKVEDIKEKLISENNGINWKPKAAYNAFNSWLENIRDNSISKQRFWGTPLPIWKNVEDEDDYIVVGSSEELEKLCGYEVKDLHKPMIDSVEFEIDGKKYRRIPDVADVWVDAGVASFACLNYPQEKEHFENLFPAEFILEGKDQIRGWFNLLHLVSLIAFDKKCFNTCYMHGYINDSQGRKMSKSVGNYILPEEVISKYGTDASRTYFVGCANPGLDAFYNFDDCELRSRNQHVLWNLHKFVIDMQKTNSFTDVDVRSGIENLSLEEKFMFSKLHSAIHKATKVMENYDLNEFPYIIEDVYLELSRTYIQLIRDKASMGTKEEKQVVFATLVKCIKEIITMYAITAPFITEQMYFNLKQTNLEDFKLESVHENTWPIFEEDLIDEDLEKGMIEAQKIITYTLSARDKAKIGVRWPLKELIVDVSDKIKSTLIQYEDLIKSQLNVKHITYEKIPVRYDIKPNYKAIGAKFGTETGDIIPHIMTNKIQYIKELEADKDKFEINGKEFSKDMFVVEVLTNEGECSIIFDGGKVKLNLDTDENLLAEGYSREVTRRIQNLRKNEGLEKIDEIKLFVDCSDKKLLENIMNFETDIKNKVGAKEIILNCENSKDTFKVKDVEFKINFEKI
ncbi:MAG: isoleucine--tRNA ligase [Candidatus Woesearchaeota archaeon]